MTGTQIVAIVFIALFLIEIDNFRLKKMLKEFLRENNNDR